LKQFCDIAKIRIKLYWYENRTRGEGKQLKDKTMWDKNSDDLKNAPLFEIGIIDKHHVAYKDTNISKYAIENYEKVKSKTKWWLPVKKQKGKNALWVLHEMLKRKDTFYQRYDNRRRTYGNLALRQ
jgi:hypothetical protein